MAKCQRCGSKARPVDEEKVCEPCREYGRFLQWYRSLNEQRNAQRGARKKDANREQDSI